MENILNLPKLGHGHRDVTSGSGATITNRVELSAKWNSNAQITRIDYATSTATFAAGSMVIVEGRN